MLKTLDEAQHELWNMRADVEADFGEELGDEAVPDLLVSLSYQVESDEVMRQLCRMELGYIPMQLEDRLGARDYLDV